MSEKRFTNDFGGITDWHPSISPSSETGQARAAEMLADNVEFLLKADREAQGSNLVSPLALLIGPANVARLNELLAATRLH